MPEDLFYCIEHSTHHPPPDFLADVAAKWERWVWIAIRSARMHGQSDAEKLGAFIASEKCRDSTRGRRYLARSRG